MALAVDQRDADVGEAAKADARAMMEGGATVGGTPVVAAVMSAGQFDTVAGQASSLPDVVEAQAIATVRALRTKPLALLSATVAGLPPAADHPGGMAYVTNGAAGAPVVAFSDGSTWLRMDTRTPVTP